MLLIGNEEVASLLDMRACVDVQEEAFRAIASGGSIQRPRTDIYVPCTRPDGYYRWGSVEGAYDGILASRLKSDVITWRRNADGSLNESKHAIEPGTYCGLVLLFSTDDGTPLAIVNDGHLQHVRVGAAAGLGARLLSREDSAVIGLIGSGGMAHTYLEAFCAVREIREVRVFSRSADKREAFAKAMTAQLGLPVTPMDNAAAAVRGADILSLCTDSVSPVLDPAWLEPGMHVTNLTRAEIPPEAMDRFDVLVHQGEDGLPFPENERFKKHIGQSPGAFLGGSEEEMRRLPKPFHPAPRPKTSIDVLDILAHGREGRTSAEQITYYRNSGNNGIQFAAVAGLAYRRAIAAGTGRALPTEWFIQDIRN